MRGLLGDEYPLGNPFFVRFNAFPYTSSFTVVFEFLGLLHVFEISFGIAGAAFVLVLRVYPGGGGLAFPSSAVISPGPVAWMTEGPNFTLAAKRRSSWSIPKAAAS